MGSPRRGAAELKRTRTGVGTADHALEEILRERAKLDGVLKYEPVRRLARAEDLHTGAKRGLPVPNAASAFHR